MAQKIGNSPTPPTIVEMACPSCKGPALIKVLSVTIPNESPTVISSFECQACNLQESATYDGDIGHGEGVDIACCFSAPEDLKRCIRLPKLSSVKFKCNKDEFEYSSGVSGIYIVEDIIRNSIRDLAGIFNIETASVSSMGERKSVENVVGDRDAAEVQLRMLEGLLKCPKFNMDIKDNTGLARVAPRGKLLSEVANEDDFNDGVVKHNYFMVERED